MPRSVYKLTKLVPKLTFVTLTRSAVPTAGREAASICHFVKSAVGRRLSREWAVLPAVREAPQDKKDRLPPEKEGAGPVSEAVAAGP